MRGGYMDSEQPAKPASEPSEGLLSGRFSGRSDFEQLVRDALARAAREGWREIILCDATFEDWPLREREVVASLQAWSSSGRRLTMLATRYDEVMRHQPRFVAWRKTWGHILDCRVCRTASALDFPSVILSPAWFMHRLDPSQSRGICGDGREYWVKLREMLDEHIRNSSPGFPASTLGL